MDSIKKWIKPQDMFPAIFDLLEEGYKVEFTVTGESMWPLLHHGSDTVILCRCDKDSLRVGDIVLIRVTQEKYLLHRITAMSGKMVQTAGDGNCCRDGWITTDSVLGRVTKVKRNGRELCVEKFGWRILARIWMLLFPFRKWIFKLWDLLRK